MDLTYCWPLFKGHRRLLKYFWCTDAWGLMTQNERLLTKSLPLQTFQNPQIKKTESISITKTEVFSYSTSLLLSLYPKEMTWGYERVRGNAITWWLSSEATVVHKHPPKSAENRLPQLLYDHIHPSCLLHHPLHPFPPWRQGPSPRCRVLFTI